MTNGADQQSMVSFTSNCVLVFHSGSRLVTRKLQVPFPGLAVVFLSKVPNMNCFSKYPTLKTKGAIRVHICSSGYKCVHFTFKGAHKIHHDMYFYRFQVKKEQIEERYKYVQR